MASRVLLTYLVMSKSIGVRHPPLKMGYGELVFSNTMGECLS